MQNLHYVWLCPLHSPYYTFYILREKLTMMFNQTPILNCRKSHYTTIKQVWINFVKYRDHGIIKFNAVAVNNLFIIPVINKLLTYLPTALAPLILTQAKSINGRQKANKVTKCNVLCLTNRDTVKQRWLRGQTDRDVIVLIKTSTGALRFIWKKTCQYNLNQILTPLSTVTLKADN